MADSKSSSHSTIDKSKSGKQDEKEENFISKAAHSIKDKVHGLADDVKEKAHQIKHGEDSKKDKDQKKTDAKSKTDKKDDDDKKDTGVPSSSPKPPGGDLASKPSGLPSSGAEKKDSTAAPSSASKPPGGDLASKPSGLPSDGAEKKDSTAAPSSASKLPGGDEKKDSTASLSSSKPPSSDSKTPGENKDGALSRDSAAKPSGALDDDKKVGGVPSSSKPLGSEGETEKPSNRALTQPTDKRADASGDANASNKAAVATNVNDRVHLSFDGVTTVDDLLDRIDQAVENAKIVVDDGKGKGGKQTDDSGKKSEDEPIRLVYGNIHTIEDILVAINNQPGHRKVVLEGAPDQSSSVPLQKTANRPSAAGIGDENIDSSKTLNPADESSTSSGQIHVNIENVKNVDDFLDRIDEAVQKVPVVISAKSQDNKNQEPSGSNQNKKPEDDDKKEFAAAMKFQKDVPKDDGDGETHRF